MNNRARQFRYQRPTDDSVFVRVMVQVAGDHYVETIAQLASELHASIPFEHRVDVKPRAKTSWIPGTLMELVVVDMVIEHSLTPLEACASLRNEGYWEEEQ